MGSTRVARCNMACIKLQHAGCMLLAVYLCQPTPQLHFLILFLILFLMLMLYSTCLLPCTLLSPPLQPSTLLSSAALRAILSSS